MREGVNVDDTSEMGLEDRVGACGMRDATERVSAGSTPTLSIHERLFTVQRQCRVRQRGIEGVDFVSSPSVDN
jgi:hypothetical protein